ncbi:MAG: lactate utilization protein [Acutalibacteraceae bacterium]|nr:lactate utilization protein [Acutalibacteraceae bacterium]
MDERIKKVTEALRANNMEVFFAESKEQIPEIVKGILKKGEVISCGGSVTLAECGVTELMRSGDYCFLDRSLPGLTREQINDIYVKTFGADAFITSANAVTEKGELVNVDGNANRVAAIAFGPKKVICIVGANKIVSSVEEGFKRVKTVAAPKNAVRLNTSTPCKTLGHCIYPDGDIATGCKSPDRLCAHYTVAAFQRNKDRIKVIITPDSLGY